MIDVHKNYHELMTDLKRTRDSAMQFYDEILVSLGRWCAFDDPVTHLVTLSKLYIHFLRSDCCPPTLTMYIDTWPIVKRVSVIATVFAHARRTSSLDGT